MLKEYIEDDPAAQMDALYQKRIRLEISGWWYSAAEAKSFLLFQPDEDELKKVPKQIRENYKGHGLK